MQVNESNLPSNISANELEKIHESLKVVQGGGKKKQTVCAETGKKLQNMLQFAELQRLSESTVRPWVKKLQKIYTGTEEDGSIQCGTKDWKS